MEMTTIGETRQTVTALHEYSHPVFLNFIVISSQFKFYLPFVKKNKKVNKYLLLTEFEVRTVSYGPSLFPLIYGPSAKRAGHKSTGKK